MSTNNANNSTPNDDLPANLTAHALNQLHGDDLAALQTYLAQHPNDDTERDLHQTRSLAAALSLARSSEELPTPSPDLRNRLEQNLAEPATNDSVQRKVELPIGRKPFWRPTVVEWSVLGVVCCVLAALFMPAIQGARESSRRVQSANELRMLAEADDYVATPTNDPESLRYTRESQQQSSSNPTRLALAELSAAQAQAENESEVEKARSVVTVQVPFSPAPIANPTETYYDSYMPVQRGSQKLKQAGRGLARESKPSDQLAVDPFGGRAADLVKEQQGQTQGVGQAQGDRLGRKENLQMAVVPRIILQEEEEAKLGFVEVLDDSQSLAKRTKGFQRREGEGGEQYDPITENPFFSPRRQPLSTFSIDVDTASYANVRRFLTSGRLPPPNSVRIEELVNYFRYDYPQPKTNDPFSVNMEVAECPWREGHLLLRVGLKGKEVNRAERPQSNLVFLLDVSGSMADQNKLPLLKTALQMLVRELGENDRVSIVTYAGEAGLRLPPTRGHEQQKIHAAIESLQSGGSTNGSAGINLAYEQAAAYFIPGGTNRVILCTDGDLNVGVTSDDALVKLIKQKATGGTFLTVLGFGEGNLKDAKMEKLADNGNGLYAYIDSVREARKVLVEQLTGSTITIAKDVKIQIEFNPSQISAYRLLGYENRLLAAQDFNNDKKDAGEIGAGHTVTALYELVPAGAKPDTSPPQPGIDPLKYQKSDVATAPPSPEPRTPSPSLPSSPELLTLKLRYKQPDGDTSKLLEYPLADRGASFNSASPDFQFAAAVASFGMILRGSEHRGTSTLAAVAETASAALGADPSGYRAEFLDLIRKAQALQSR